MPFYFLYCDFNFVSTIIFRSVKVIAGAVDLRVIRQLLTKLSNVNVVNKYTCWKIMKQELTTARKYLNIIELPKIDLLAALVSVV